MLKVLRSFEKNIVDKFFGSPLDKIDINLPDIKKSLDGISVINQKIETINEVIRDDLPKMVRILEKVKIPHDKTNNVVYTIQSGFLDWTSENNILNITAAVKGISVVNSI